MKTKKLSLDKPVTYEIKTTGVIEEKQLDWNGGMTIEVELDKFPEPITTLTIKVDQAGLQGLLRHLYSLGISLISVVCKDYS